MNAIEISNLTKTYTKGIKTKVEALKELNLEVKMGEIFGFLGPNGAGKSTTIKLILDIIRPTSGSILLSGKDSGDHESRRVVGYLPENPIFYEYLTPEELLCFVGKTFNMQKNEIKVRTDDLIKMVGLEKFRSVPIRNFSKGMVQKVGLIQALVHDPEILILDEPSSGLDPIGRRQVADLLLDLKQKGKTIFFSSHLLHDVETICDRTSIIVNGKLTFLGSMSEIKQKSSKGFEVLVPANCDIQPFLEQKKYSYTREGELQRIDIDEDHLWTLLDELKKSNIKLVSIEPKRLNLEALFLEQISNN